MTLKHLRRQSITNREIKIKTTLRFDFTHVRMAKVKKHKSQLILERMCSKGNTIPLLMGVHTCVSLWNSVCWFFRNLGINLTQDPVILHLGIYPKDVQSYHHVYNSFICNSQQLEIITVPQLIKKSVTLTQWSITQLSKQGHHEI